MEEKKISEFGLVDWKDEPIYDVICQQCRLKEEEGEDSDGTIPVASNGRRADLPRSRATVKKSFDPDDIDHVAMALVSAVQGDMDMLKKFNMAKFKEITGVDTDIPYDEIRHRGEELIALTRGYGYLKNFRLPMNSTYVIFGDSNGLHVEDGILSVVKEMCETLGARPIHVGPALDRNHFISEKMLRLPNLAIVARQDEIFSIAERYDSRDNITIYRDSVIAGKALIACQYLRTQYTYGSSKGILFSDEGHEVVIYDRPKHELHSITKHGRACMNISVGCSCKKFENKAPRKNKTPLTVEELSCHLPMTKTAMRSRAVTGAWENGIVVLHVDENGTTCPIMCRLKKVKGKWTTSYFGNIITEDGFRTPDKLTFVIGDVHVPKHDPKALDIADQIAFAMSPDCFVNLGDHCDSSSLNHHALDRGQVITDYDVASDFGSAKYILRIMSRWAKELYLIIGNHERFVEDYHKKNNTVKSLINIESLISPQALGYKLVELKGVIDGGPWKIVHGDLRNYGATGDVSKKMKRVMEKDSMCGHRHRPEIREGAYCIGLMGKMDQEYNEVEASNWIHGYGIVSTFEGEAFMSTVPIIDYKTFYDGKWITPRENLEMWNPQVLNAEVDYTFAEDDARTPAVPAIEGFKKADMPAGEIDYRQVATDICKVVFGADNQESLAEWMSTPCDDNGEITPADLFAEGRYKEIYELLVFLFYQG